jgi:hypothetical protein
VVGIGRIIIAIVIALLAAVGAMVVHYNAFVQSDSIGIGMGVFALVGAFMLYRIVRHDCKAMFRISNSGRLRSEQIADVLISDSSAGPVGQPLRPFHRRDACPAAP